MLKEDLEKAWESHKIAENNLADQKKFTHKFAGLVRDLKVAEDLANSKNSDYNKGIADICHKLLMSVGYYEDPKIKGGSTIARQMRIPS